MSLTWPYHWWPFRLPEIRTTTDAEGRYHLAAEHVCAIHGSACSVSFTIETHWDGERRWQSFDEVDVAGDSLALTVDFEDL